eukprot:922582-Prorocentrum_minimum.AAC.1
MFVSSPGRIFLAVPQCHRLANVARCGLTGLASSRFPVCPDHRNPDVTPGSCSVVKSCSAWVGRGGRWQVGGVNIAKDIRAFNNGEVDILVATPGRLQ